MTRTEAAGMKRFSIRPCVAILGLGDTFRMDVGVGVHAVRELQKAPPREVIVAEVGHCAIDAFCMFDDADTIIAIGAVRAGGRPATIYWFSARDARAEFKASLRDLGIVEALRHLSDPARPDVMVLGIEPAEVGYGGNLSRALENVLPRVVNTARGIAGELKRRGHDASQRRNASAIARRMLG